MADKPDDDFRAVYAAIVERFDASPADMRAIANTLRNFAVEGDGDELDVSGLSEHRRRILAAIIGAAFHSRQDGTSASRGGVNYLPETSSPNKNGGNSTHANNASKLMLLFMDECEVEAIVGDLLEQLPRFQERFGGKYGLFHFWWSVCSFVLGAIWEKTPVAKALSAWLGNREGS